MKSVITISRQCGAGGRAIGKLVAENLGYEYYDKALITEAAKNAELDMEMLVKYDERIHADFGFAQSLLNISTVPLNEKVYLAQQKVMRKLAEKGRCVIVGRNSNVTLREFDNTFHVFIFAPLAVRKANMHARMKEATDGQISEIISSTDRARAKYCAHFTGTEFENASSYDLCVSSGKFSPEVCAKIICELARED